MSMPGHSTKSVAARPSTRRNRRPFCGTIASVAELQAADVIVDGGTTISAVAYVANDECVCPEGSPGEEYLGRILRGAKQHGLPSEYVEQIGLLAEGNGGE